MADYLPVYKGDSNLGLVDTGIPVTTNKDLDLINQTSRDIYVNNIARNQQLFQQKLRDRDQLLAAIDSGDIKVGSILEEDTPVVKQGLEKLDEAFQNRIKKGINDLDALREYNRAKRDAQDRVTQAQGRKLFYDKESGAIGSETLPKRQEARKKNLEGVIKGGFWKDITPYQQTQDLDIAGSILSTAANVTEQFTDPKTFTKGKRTVFDYDKTKLANQDNFLNDVNKRYDQQQLLSSIQELPPPQFVETVKAMNSRIQEYNDIKGLKPGQPGFVDPLKVQIVNNKPVIGESLPDFAAKYTLAHQKPFGATETEFDKERANFALGKERNAIAAMKGRAYVDNLRQQMSLRKTQQEKDEYLDELWTRNFTNQKTLLKSVGDKMDDKFILKDLDADESLPIYTIQNGAVKQLAPIGGTAVKDSRGNVLYYTGGHYKPTYSLGGKSVAHQTIVDIYNNMKKQQGDKWKGSFDDFLKQAIENNKIRVTLQGQNGVTDEELSRAAQQLISNKGTKKGQTGVFDDSVDSEDNAPVIETQTSSQYQPQD